MGSMPANFKITPLRKFSKDSVLYNESFFQQLTKNVENRGLFCLENCLIPY